MKTRLLLLLLCALLLGLTSRTPAQSKETSRPPIAGIMGFRLGMTRAEAMHVAQKKGWMLERDGSDVLRLDFIKTKQFSGLEFTSLSLSFAPSGLARIFLGSPREHYDKEKTLMSYPSAQFLQNLEEKYGLPVRLWYGHNGTFDDNPRGYRYLTLQSVAGEEYDYTSALELTWQNGGRRIWVGYFKKSASIHAGKVFVGVFYEDDALWRAYHQMQARDY